MKDPADSLESAGFLHSSNKYSFLCEVHIILFVSGFDAWKTVFALVPTGDPSSLRFGHPDVTTGDTVFPRLDTWCCGRGYMHLCVYRYSGYAAVPPGLRQMRGGFVCALCLANWGGGGLSRFSLVVGCFACRYTKARRNSQNRSGQTLKLVYRTGQICVTNSRKSFTSLPCSSRPVP